MYRFWDAATRDLLDAIQATRILEVGSDRGYQTELLLDWCGANGAVAHVIDPLPKYDVRRWSARWGARFDLHRDLSLEAIPRLKHVPEIVLIDGDHNWYTVWEELRALDRLAGDGRLPVVLLHDVAWPYGRRDLYYEPDTIPPEFRHPHARAGMVLGSPELDPVHGLNSHLDNAEREGGPRNGVLTAVEDFVAASSRALHLRVVPAIHGLGVLIESGWLEDAAVAAWFEGLSDLPHRAELIIAATERERLQSLIRAAERGQEAASRDQVNREDPRFDYLDERLRASERAVRALRDQLDAGLAESAALRAQLGSERQRVRRLRADKERLQAQRAKLRGRLAQQRARSKQQEARIVQLNRRLRGLERRKLVRLANLLSSIRRRLRATKPDRADDLQPEASTDHPTLANASEQRRPDAATAAGSAAPDDERATARDATPASQVRARMQPREPAEGRHQADVVVCVHDAPDDTRRCLESVMRNTDLKAHRLIVVDDGSGPDAGAVVDRFAAEVDLTLVRNREARGYTRAANQGLRASTGDFVVLLNSDTIVTPRWLDLLVACATHHDSVGAVGPLSNAASWQSIPATSSSEGWVINEAPSGDGLDLFAERLAASSSRLYPEVPVLNGFCYLITRNAFETIGELDEAAFPRGYGEEDDFSLRCREAGFSLHVADDCYIYHAKSKSFTEQGRRRIVERSKVKLRERHGQRVDDATDHMGSSAPLRRARAHATCILHGADDQVPAPAPRDVEAMRIGWLQPHLDVAGGIRRAIEMGNRLAQRGHELDLITPDGVATDWLPISADVRSVDDAAERDYDVLVISDPDVVDHVDRISARRLVAFHLGGYAVYRREDEQLSRFYSMADALHIANSTWTAEVACERNPALEIAGIVPGGVDLGAFRPTSVEADHDLVFHGSRRPHKGTALILAAAGARSRLALADRDAPQDELAYLMGRGRVFVSAAWHEGFNLSCIEAMACGVPVVMTDDGGSRDYAKDEHNALVVPRGNIGALSAAISRVIDDQELAYSLVLNGFKTAWSHEWDWVTRTFEGFVLGDDRSPPLGTQHKQSVT